LRAKKKNEKKISASKVVKSISYLCRKIMTACEIYNKYYSAISYADFQTIVAIDDLTSNLERGKVGMYAKWLLRIYQKLETKRIHASGIENARKVLHTFDRMSKANMLAEKDINKYNSLSEMRTVVEPYLDTQIISNNDYTRQKKEEGVDKLYEDEQFLVVHPKTKWAASTYGRHTRWCTATNKYAIDYFKNYNGKGKLYIIIDKKRNRKYQFHFDTRSYMDEKDKELTRNGLGAIKRLKATDGLINFFINERQEKYLVDDETGKLNIAEGSKWNSDNNLRVAIHRKKYGIILGAPNLTPVVGFYYDLIKPQQYLPNLYETYINGETDLCGFANNQIFLNVFWYSACKKKFVELNMQLDDAFYPRMPLCYTDLSAFLKFMEKKFNRRNIRKIAPNSLSANTLTIAILEYAYYGSSKSNEDYQTVINKCKNRISEYGKNEIPKIITRQKINGLDLFFVIDNKIRNGVFRLQYAEILDKKKLTN